MKWRCLIVPCLLLAAGGPAEAQEAATGKGAAVHDYIGVYRKYFHDLKDTRCPMYPTCSGYGEMVFADHPFPVAMAMTADRLMRCGGDLERYPMVASGRHYGRRLDYPPGREVPSHLADGEPPAVAAETIVPTDSVSRAVQFTNLLINRHCYASAMLEIDRLLYADTAFRHVPSLYVNKLRCFEGLRQYADGLLFYEQGMPDGIRSAYKVRYTAAHLYGLVGDHGRAIGLYREAALAWDSDGMHPYGELAKLYAQESMFGEARDALSLKYAIDSNLSAFALSNAAIGRLEGAPRKSPATAMLLGIVPGGGYLYAGQPRDALVSFLVNGVLAYAAYTSVKTGNYGLGIILGAFSISFYGGNIMGSGASAGRYNDKARRDAIAELQNTNPFYY